MWRCVLAGGRISVGAWNSLSPMRFTRRDLVWLAVLLVPSLGWWYEHWTAINRQRKSQAVQADLAARADLLLRRLGEYESREKRFQVAQTDLAIALRQQVELSEQMAQRLDEYESQHVLMRRLLRVAQQRRE